MFSGIVEAVAEVVEAGKKQGSLFVRIKTPAGWTLGAGESVLIDGVCSTVRRAGKIFEVEFIPETLRKTTFLSLRAGSRVNLERCLTLNKLIGGHLVQGHVDCVGKIAGVARQGKSKVFKIKFPRKFAPLVVQKGFVAVDGISLTIVDCGPDWFSVALIQYTLSHTTIGQKIIGDGVNVEFDFVGKYLYKWAQHARGS